MSYVISYKEAFFEKENKYLCMVMELAETELHTKIKQHQENNTRFEENEIWTLFIQILKGLGTLHDKSVMH